MVGKKYPEATFNTLFNKQLPRLMGITDSGVLNA